MKKIGLVGLYSIDNMGDCLICETTRFLIKDYAKDSEVLEIDAAPRKISSYPGIYKLNLFISAFIIRIIARLVPQNIPRSKISYYLERFAWRLKLQWHFKKVIPNCDVVIFSGGGFLKFRTQGLNYIVEQVVDVCERNNIPVMFSGVGIEGFDSHDYRCRALKRTLSSPSIRTITTRDYFEVLTQNYEVNPPTHTAVVGDPAFWTPECYGIQKRKGSQKIGINIIREDIFKDYDNRLSARDLKSFYIGIISRLDADGADWVLFSNGMQSDHEFGLSLLQEMGKSEDLILPQPRTAKEMISLISNFQTILGARMHACISAYALDIPVVGLIWNEKLTRFAESTHQRHMFFQEDELNVGAMCMRLLNSSNFAYDDDVRQELKTQTQIEIGRFLQSHILDTKDFISLDENI